MKVGTFSKTEKSPKTQMDTDAIIITGMMYISQQKWIFLVSKKNFFSTFYNYFIS